MKKVNIYTVLLLLVFYIPFYAKEQFSDYATKRYSIIPPAPEVSSMMKYIDIPVSHFTGQPQIEIPIYTLKEGSLSVPVTLSYRGGGIKQDELPGIISKGWSLNAGITISRNVYGLPDNYNINRGTQREIRGLFHLRDSDKVLRNQIIAFEGDYNPSSPNDNTTYTDAECSDYENGYVDFANDIYKFYGQGMSGTLTHRSIDFALWLKRNTSVVSK